MKKRRFNRRAMIVKTQQISETMCENTLHALKIRLYWRTIKGKWAKQIKHTLHVYIETTISVCLIIPLPF